MSRPHAREFHVLRPPDESRRTPRRGLAIGHHNLGRALAAAGRHDAAATAFTRALALESGFAEAHKDLGLMLMAQGRFQEASGCFARTLQLVPELAENAADTTATL